MSFAKLRFASAAVLVGAASVALAQSTAPPPLPAAAPAIATVPGMPPVADPANLYSETTAAKLSPAVAGDLPRVYVPHVQSNDVYVIDPATFTVVGKFKVGLNPQHVVPSWDLRTLWVANNAENTTKGSVTPVDPKTGKPGKAIPVDDPYNMYFSPDGKSAIMSAMKKTLPSGDARMSCGMPFHVVQITSSRPSGPLTVVVVRPGWITCV